LLMTETFIEHNPNRVDFQWSKCFAPIKRGSLIDNINASHQSSEVRL
jgi:hypothetical protein